jgi:hypothetical protein
VSTTWVWVRDTALGHEYDVPLESFPLPDGLVEVPGVPRLSGPGAVPRPAVPNATPAEAIRKATAKSA